MLIHHSLGVRIRNLYGCLNRFVRAVKIFHISVDFHPFSCPTGCIPVAYFPGNAPDC